VIFCLGYSLEMLSGGDGKHHIRIHVEEQGTFIILSTTDDTSPFLPFPLPLPLLALALALAAGCS